ncbi:hypothetical protein [Acetobacter persici]|uniref:DNA-binding protein n=1 Tax=Acetobacter persici TaxID=1076596 RepID=A0A1U9LEK0_9PROT|nr:hypothetical protein [Acetobacter persici]AQT04832.1 hypothetical protein A0U91_07770 [Acetobacter persici]
MNSFPEKAKKGLLGEVSFCARMNAAIRAAGSAAAFARMHNLNPQAVRNTWDLKSINPEVVAALGLVQVTRYPVLSQPGILAAPKDVQEKLNSFIREHKTQRRAAGIFGIHETHLSNIQNGLRGFGPVLAILGYGPPERCFLEKAAYNAAS